VRVEGSNPFARSNAVSDFSHANVGGHLFQASLAPPALPSRSPE